MSLSLKIVLHLRCAFVHAANRKDCASLFYDGQVTNIPLFSPASYPGTLAPVVSAPQNAASETTSGLDFQADYNIDIFNGNLAWHFLGSYTDELTLNGPDISYDSAGSLGGNSRDLRRDRQTYRSLPVKNLKLQELARL